MKKAFAIIFLFLLWENFSQAQALNDTASLRNFINTTIKANATQSITGANLNRALNGQINVLPGLVAKKIDSVSVSGSTMSFWRNGSVAFTKTSFQQLEDQRLSTGNSVTFNQVSSLTAGGYPLPVGTYGNNAFDNANFLAQINESDYAAGRYPGWGVKINGVDAAFMFYRPVQESTSLNYFQMWMLGIQGTYKRFMWADDNISTLNNNANYTAASGATTGKIPIYTSSNQIGNSSITESGSSVTVSKDLYGSGNIFGNSVSSGNAIITSTGGGTFSAKNYKIQTGTGSYFSNIVAPTTVSADVYHYLPNTTGTLISKIAGLGADATGNVVVTYMNVNNVTTEPPTNASGGTFYVEGGSLKYKGSSGTVTVLAGP